MTLIINSDTNSQEIKKLLISLSADMKFDSSKHLGKIKIDKDPKKIQKELRDEWN